MLQEKKNKWSESWLTKAKQQQQQQKYENWHCSLFMLNSRRS